MDEVSPRKSRTLAAVLEPVIGQVFFAPECHAAYAELGFSPSPGQAGLVHLPDGPAYFTSRGSLLGQVRPGVVAAAFGVFKPEIVSAGVTLGWSLTDASTIFNARRDGAVAQLERVVGSAGDDVVRAAELLERAVSPLSVAGRPLFAGLRSWWDDPTDPWTRLFHLGDMLRECRGDAHVAAWSSAALDGLEIGLLNDIYMGLPLRSYVRTRGWSEEDLAGGVERLRDLGWLDGEEFTDEGRAVREDIEEATDLQMVPALEALDDDIDEAVKLLRPWGVAMREAGGYVGGPVDLWPVRDD
jgi:helix-turn-helix protein